MSKPLGMDEILLDTDEDEWVKSDNDSEICQKHKSSERK